MEKEDCYIRIIDRINKTFTPSDKELDRIETRFKKYDKTELKHLYQNFELFGIDEVLECLVEAKREL